MRQPSPFLFLWVLVLSLTLIHVGHLARRHWNAQRLLEPAPVVIPFAEALTFPTAWMRTRRDHARFLNLIEVSAFLHQHQRRRIPVVGRRETGDGRNGLPTPDSQLPSAVVAEVADYAVAYQLAAQVLSETLSDVKKPLREAHEQIKTLSLAGDGSVSRREIREALKVPDSTVRRWLQDLVDFEYLSVVTTDGGKPGQGKTLRYVLMEREPREDELGGLLAPRELQARLREARP